MDSSGWDRYSSQEKERIQRIFTEAKRLIAEKDYDGLLDLIRDDIEARARRAAQGARRTK